jgi:hypothetical protein
MDPNTVRISLQMLGSAWKTLEATRERAQTSKDIVLKANINRLYDEFLELKSIIVRLGDENDELRGAKAANEPKPELRQVGGANYYFFGEDGPYCQPCYDVDADHRRVSLTQRQKFLSGFGRQCLVCSKVFIEEEGPAPQARIATQRRPYTWG